MIVRSMNPSRRGLSVKDRAGVAQAFIVKCIKDENSEYAVYTVIGSERCPIGRTLRLPGTSAAQVGLPCADGPRG